MLALASAATLLAVLAAAPAALQAASPGTNPFTSGVTRFIFDTGTIESVKSREGLPGAYKPDVVFYQFCLPPGDSETNTVASGTFVVAPDGKLTGTCKATRSVTSSDGTVDSIVKEGTLSGTYDLAAQTVKFHFEGSSERSYVPSCQRCESTTTVASIVVDGPVSGGEVVGDRAEGTARHTYTCGPATVCYVSSQVATAKFVIQFLPALATAAPGAGGGAGTIGGDDGLDAVLPIILLLLLLVLALGVLLLRRMARANLAAPAGAAEAGAAEAGVAEARALRQQAFTAATELAGQTGSVAEGPTAEGQVKDFVETAPQFLGDDAGDQPGVPEPSSGPPMDPSTPGVGVILGSKPGGGPLAAMARQVIREKISPVVGADRSGGFEDTTEYGEGAQSAAPAASKAYEALVVAGSAQSAEEEPLIQSDEKEAAEDERDRAKESGSDREGR